jgi:3-deoxy-manno-octulosonate cytidylyltransferase (CMP-KDO synthetase)
MHTAIIVPGRLASSRFPRKLLFPIKGIPLIVRTAQRIRTEVPNLPLFFAVDHADLAQCLHEAEFDSIMTRDDHVSGTDRIAEANALVGADFVINVQADEPLIQAAQILQLSKLIQEPGIALATLAHRFHNPQDFYNPNQVKVVISNSGEALYFSRSPIPYPRDIAGQVSREWLNSNACYRHIGLYAYTRDFLSTFTTLNVAAHEQIEKLEQLRALAHGYRIAVGVTEANSAGVDTPDDVACVESLIE